jgi:flagellar basal body-associated protein FliL
MVIVSSKVTSSKVLKTVVMEMIVMIVIAMMIMIYCVMNNFLLVMHFVDKMWDVHPDVYAENQNQDKFLQTHAAIKISIINHPNSLCIVPVLNQ